MYEYSTYEYANVQCCCRKVAVTQDNNVLVFHAPGQTIEFNPFVLYRTFYGAYDETTCIDWTTDSRLTIYLWFMYLCL